MDLGDSDGLSVFKVDSCSAEEVIAEFNTCYGLATLHIGRLRDLGLRVVADPKNSRKVLITDLPLESDSSAHAQWLAEQAAKTAKIFSRLSPPYRKR